MNYQYEHLECCNKVQSFGALKYFCRENKPEGAPEFCYQGCPLEAECPYSAVKLYRHRQVPWFAKHATKKHDPTEADVVNLEYESGATVSFTMSAFNKGGRKIRIMGTKGELEGQMDSDHITICDFVTRTCEQIKIKDAVLDESIAGGHGGGDLGIVRALCQVLADAYTGNSVADITTSIENHLVTFAAEESRLTGNVITMEEYKNKILSKNMPLKSTPDKPM